MFDDPRPSQSYHRLQKRDPLAPCLAQHQRLDLDQPMNSRDIVAAREPCTYISDQIATLGRNTFASAAAVTDVKIKPSSRTPVTHVPICCRYLYQERPPPIPTPPGVLSGRVLKNPVTEINKSRSGHRATLISVCSISISPAPVFFPTRVRGLESQKEKNLPSETESSFSVTSSAT